MRHVRMSDVNKRLKSLYMINSAPKTNNTFSERAQININTRRVSDIKRLIENAGVSNSIVSFNEILNLFDTLTEVGTVSDISKMGKYISESIVHKSRDAKKYQAVLKRRLTTLQNKLSVPFDAQEKKKHKAIKEAYNDMLESFIVCENCDRMLENYNRVSKRFNLEAVINENTRINGVYDTVVELCNRIDTYEMPDTVKFNTVIETALYGFESNFISYKKSDILEAACNYFAFKKNGLNSCKEILDATLFYDKDDDMKNIDILTEEEPEEDSKESSVDSMIRSHYSDDNSTITESSSFSEIFNKFKEEELSKDGKPETKLRSLVTKLYSRNVDSIVDETPDLLRWIRSFFIVGSAAVPIIGPILMIIGYIADRFISLHMDAEETKKMIACFNNEINKSKAKLESTKDTEEKERLEKYIKSLEDAKEKISIYRMGLTDDLDVDDEYSKYQVTDDKVDGEFDSMLKDFDLDFDDDDLDFTFSEMGNIADDISQYKETLNMSENFMRGLPSKLDNSIIIDLAEAVSYFPDIFFAESFCEGLQDEIDATRYENKKSRSYQNYIRISQLESALKLLKESNNTVNTNSKSLLESLRNLSVVDEIYSAINMINSISEDSCKETILEASFSNTLKLASMKLKNAFKKLSDKDRAISKNIDLSLNNFKKGVERSLTNDNREAVIKGSILPSASKIIKLGIANAAVAVLINPALAVIGTLGYLGCSAKYKNKERQMLIDEIEIEMKMCDKYIEIAEQKNDMKALKQLLTTKRDLERQQQRIKYKMRVELGQKYYDPKHVGDE